MLKSMKHFNKISLFAHQPLFENSKAIYFICLFTLTRGMRYLFEGGAGNKKLGLDRHLVYSVRYSLRARFSSNFVYHFLV